MRTFQLIRTEDVTGLSGTGVVAEGVEFTDGTVVMRWLTAPNAAPGIQPTTVMHPNIENVEKLHAHNGSSEVQWQ